MNFRPVARLLKRLVLGVLAIAGVCAILITWLVHSDRYQRYYHAEILISKQLGWSVQADDREAFRQQVLAEPRRLLSLLQNKYSTEVRVAAGQMLDRLRIELPDEVLDECIAELAGPSSYNKKDLLEAIRFDSRRTFPRLLALYRADSPVDPSLHSLICQSNFLLYDDEGGFSEGLIKIVADSAVPQTNRCLAAQALGYMKPVGDSHAFKKDTRLADFQRILPSLPEHVACVARVSLDALLKKRPPALEHWEEFYWIRIQLPITDHGQDAMLALTDQHDWLRVCLAAELLARNNIQAAIPALQKVAANYWYRPVRKVATQAISILEGREPCPTGPLNSPYDLMARKDRRATSLEIAEAIALRGEPTSYDRIRSWLRERFEPIFYNSIYWRFLPRVDEVTWQRRGKLPQIEQINMRPRSAIDFAGGKLLGYDEGEFGAGIVFCRDGQMPEFFRTLNVVDFVRMPFGVVIDCHEAMLEGHLLFLATEGPGGIVSVRFFMRLPDGKQAINRLPSGELLIGKGEDAVLIDLKGKIRAAENPL